MVKKLFQKRISEIRDKYKDTDIIISLNSVNFLANNLVKLPKLGETAF